MHFWGMTPPMLVRELAANVAMGIPPLRRRRLLGIRTVNGSPEVEAAKIVAEFEFLLDSAGPVTDRTVLEIGPGDAIGLAPLFLSAGAARYIALDRFPGDIWGPRAQSLYQQIARHRGPFRANWQQDIELIRTSIEQPVTGVHKADVIISFDVVEHLADVPRAVKHMASLLAPDGRMIHRIDYGPHGIWVSAPDPLSFLRVPRWLWAAIGSNRGYPNRVRHPQFVQLLHQQGLHIRERITRKHGADVMDAEVVCGFQPTIALGRPFKLGSG
jgi:SAM-dependent methyltransferase